MAMNANWPRWIFASIAEHFKDNTDSLPMMVEGEQRDDLDNKDSIEVRTDGPSIIEVCKDMWKIVVDINVLVNSAMDDSNFFRLHKNVGTVAAAFQTIQVLQYDDGEALVGCMELVQRSGTREVLRISHFGQVAPNVKLLRATVEGHYEMFLRT